MEEKRIKKSLKKTRRGLRTYSKCFGPFRGLSLTLKELVTRQPKEILVRCREVASPIFLRLNTSDGLTFKKVLHDREYDLALLKQPQVIVDAGANIGLASLYYANKYPDAKIIAIEPEYSNYVLLQKNVAPYANIITMNKALWSDNDGLNVVDPGLDKWGFQTRKRTHAIGNKSMNKIDSITIDTVMHECAIPYIDILKIDIEGAEKEVFQHSTSWIDKVGVIAAELHDRSEMGCSRAFYNATNGFDYEVRKGENIFVVKKEYMNT